MNKYTEFRNDHKDIWDPVKSIIDQWDPVELLKYGAPPDEYDPEILKIVNALLSLASSFNAETLLDIFEKSFHKGVLGKKAIDCEKIVAEILAWAKLK